MKRYGDEGTKLHRGTAVLLRKRDQVRRAVITFTSHKGQALELRFEDGGTLLLFEDERCEWEDSKGAHWDLKLD